MICYASSWGVLHRPGPGAWSCPCSGASVGSPTPATHLSPQPCGGEQGTSCHPAPMSPALGMLPPSLDWPAVAFSSLTSWMARGECLLPGVMKSECWSLTRLRVCTEVVILQQDGKSLGGFTLLGNAAPSAPSALPTLQGHGRDGCGRDGRGACVTLAGRNERPGRVRGAGKRDGGGAVPEGSRGGLSGVTECPLD